MIWEESHAWLKGVKGFHSCVGKRGWEKEEQLMKIVRMRAQLENSVTDVNE